MIIINEVHRKLYGNDLKAIYGPYTRNQDLRSHVILYNGKSRTTISYPKFLLEVKLERKLVDNEQADHIDGEPWRDRLDNLQVLSQQENTRKSLEKVKIINCRCGKEFKQKFKSQKYCSRSCGQTYKWKKE